MGSTVRISVRAQFGDTLKQFQNLRTVLSSFDKQVQAVDKSLVTLGDMFDKNAAQAEAWGKKVADATKSASAAAMTTGPKGATGGVASAAAADSMMTKVNKLGDSWIAAGKKAQWTGSVMTYTLTLPVAAVYYEGMKAQTAYTENLMQLRQAYNLVGAATTDVAARNKAWAQDAGAIQKIILNLSDTYGIAQTDIAATGAELARMGDRSVSLADDLNTVVRLQRTYNLTAQQATQIVSQSRAAWGASAAATRDNTNALATLQEMGRGTFAQLAAGVNQISQPARLAGLNYKQAASYVALLLQTVNSAQGRTLGNSLTTVFARLAEVVPKARKDLLEYGISVTSAQWANDNLNQKLQLIGSVWDKLTRSQQQQLAIDLAGQRQYRALVPLLTDMASKHGQLKLMQDATSNSAKNAALAQHQLDLSLKTPQANFQMLKVQMQNVAMEIARDLTPTVMTLARLFVGSVQWFGNLPSGTRNFIVLGIAMLALIGPLTKLGGAFMTLGGTLLKMFVALGPIMMSPFGLFIIAMGVTLVALNQFGVKFSDVFNAILRVIGFVTAAVLYFFHMLASLFGSSGSNSDKIAKSLESHAAGAKSMQKSAAKHAQASNDINSAIDQFINGSANQTAGNATAAADSTADLTAQIASLVSQANAARNAIHAQAAVVLDLKIQTDAAAQSLKAANLQLRLLEQKKSELTEQRSVLGDPAALKSQATALQEMGRNIAASGNSTLARRYEEQATLLQKQADKATGLDSQLASVNNQIDAQQALVDQLTKVHDDLANSYQNESNKLADLRQNYQGLNDQLIQLRQQLRALKAQGAAQSPGNVAGVPNASVASLQGNLNEWLKLNSSAMPKMPNIGAMLGQFGNGIKQGMAQFNNQGTWQKMLQAPVIAALAIAAPAILGSMRKMLFGPITDLFKKNSEYIGKHSGLLDDLVGGGKHRAPDLSWIDKFKARIKSVTESGDGGFLDIGKMLGKGNVTKDLEDVANDAEKGIKGGLIPRMLGAVRGFGGSFLSKAFGGIASLVTTIIPDLVVAAGEAVAAFGSAIAASGILIPLAIIAAILLIAFLLIKYHKQIFAFGKKVVEFIWEGLVATWKALCNLGDHIAKWLAEAGSAVGKALGNFASWLVKTAWDFIKKYWLAVLDLPAFILVWLATSNSGVAKHIRQFGADMVHWIWNDGIVKAWDGIVDFETFIGKTVDGWATTALNAMVRLGSAIVNGIWTGLQDAWHFIDQGLTGLLNALGSNLASIIKTPVNAVIGMINNMLHAIGTVSFSVPSWVPVMGGQHFGFPTWTIPQLAMGGVVNGSTLANIGERGPEAIVPLSANNPFVQMFANTVANRMAASMARYQKASMGAGVINNTTNNVTNNVTVNYHGGPSDPPTPMTARELSYELGALMNSKGARL